MHPTAGVVYRPRLSVGRRARHAEEAAFLKPWQYRWNTLDPDTFLRYGVIATRGPRNRPYFNFSQQIWLYPGVQMDWSSRPSRAVETLAVNILVGFISERRGWVFSGNVSRHLYTVACSFAEHFLLTMPASGGRIPREVIVEWLRDVI